MVVLLYTFVTILFKLSRVYTKVLYSYVCRDVTVYNTELKLKGTSPPTFSQYISIVYVIQAINPGYLDPIGSDGLCTESIRTKKK